ncbi:7953_t:CDS:2, partial [Racocetra fulgida]
EGIEEQESSNEENFSDMSVEESLENNGSLPVIEENTTPSVANKCQSDFDKIAEVFDICSDPEDIQGASIDDALDSIEGKNKLQVLAAWPNDAYHDFMELIIEDAIEAKVNSLKASSQMHPNFIEGLSQLIQALDTFLDVFSQDSYSEDFYIKIYDAVHLENGEILRISGSFQDKEWFSNAAISAAEDQDQYESDEDI